MERVFTHLLIKNCGKMPSGDIDVFFSLKFNANGPMREANALKAELQKFNIKAVIINVESGLSIKDEVIESLDKCKMAVLFATADYGEKGTVDFSTKEELEFIKAENKPFFLIKMCEKYDSPITRFSLPPSISYIYWRVGDPLPSDLVAQVIARYRHVCGDSMAGQESISSRFESALKVSSASAANASTLAVAPAPVNVQSAILTTSTPVVSSKPQPTPVATSISNDPTNIFAFKSTEYYRTVYVPAVIQKYNTYGVPYPVSAPVKNAFLAVDRAWFSTAQVKGCAHSSPEEVAKQWERVKQESNKALLPFYDANLNPSRLGFGVNMSAPGMHLTGLCGFQDILTRKHLRILDIGCGTGQTTVYLATLCHMLNGDVVEVIGIDHVRDFILQARGVVGAIQTDKSSFLGRVRFIAGDARLLNAERDGLFDVIHTVCLTHLIYESLVMIKLLF